MSITDYISIFLIVLSMFLLGFLIGRMTKKTNANGTIIIEPSDDGERERIRFVLNMELDEIKTKHEMIFKVENQLSQ